MHRMYVLKKHIKFPTSLNSRDNLIEIEKMITFRSSHGFYPIELLPKAVLFFVSVNVRDV